MICIRISQVSCRDAEYKDSRDYRTAYKGLIDVSTEIHSIGNKESLPFLMNLLFISERDKKMTVKESIRSSFNYLKKSLLNLPFCEAEINIFNADARMISTHFQEIETAFPSR